MIVIEAWDTESIAEALNLEPPKQFLKIAEINTDSRQINSGDLFVALQGERFDGHDFLNEVNQMGAVAAIVSHIPSDFDTTSELRLFIVKDTAKALACLASYRRKQFQGPVVGLTGSSGKTTVKEMVRSIAKTKLKVLATKGNLNNHLGVPLTLLNLNEEHQVAIIEMGASGIGDIEFLTDIAKPNIVLVNNVQAAHIEGFGSLDAVAEGKGEIYQNLTNNDVAIFNVDEPRLKILMRKLPHGWHGKKIKFGFDNNAEITCSNLQANKQGYFKFDLQLKNQTASIHLNVLGEHNVKNALAAAACGVALGLSLKNIVEGIENYQGTSGRLRPLEGIKGSRLFDDTYNANPGSVKAAIDTLALMQGRKILVLGAMAELGFEVNKWHQTIGEYARQKNIDLLLTIGDITKPAIQAFYQDQEKENKYWFNNISDLINSCSTELMADSTCLIKGSRSAAMEQLVTALVLDNESAS